MIIRDEGSQPARPRQTRGAFALIELALILLLSVVFLGMLVSAIYGGQLGAGRREGMNKLKWLCWAMHSFNDAHKGLPPAFDKFGLANFPASVHVYTLPFIEEEAAFKALLKYQGKGETANRVILFFVAPDDPSNVKQDLKGIQNFAANLRVFATKGVNTRYDADMPALAEVEPGTAAIPRTFLDGTSNTMLFATKYAYCGKGGSRYMGAPNSAFAAFFGQNAARTKAHSSAKAATFQLRPTDKDCCTSPPVGQSFYRGFTLVGMGDGSALQVSAQVTPQTWNCVVQPNDGLPLGADWWE